MTENKIKSKNINTTSCNLHYIESGARGNRSVILLHGMKFKAETWLELATLDKLAIAGLHGLALDMPGFGDSPACETEQDTVLAEFIQMMEVDKPVLLGPSMGGRIALEFALNHPNVLGGLILVGAVGVEENKERLAELDLPVLILWGGADQISPPVNGEILEKGIKGARRQVFDGAPHPCYLDQPDDWHRAVLDFVGTL